MCSVSPKLALAVWHFQHRALTSLAIRRCSRPFCSNWGRRGKFSRGGLSPGPAGRGPRGRARPPAHHVLLEPVADEIRRLEFLLLLRPLLLCGGTGHEGRAQRPGPPRGTAAPGGTHRAGGAPPGTVWPSAASSPAASPPPPPPPPLAAAAPTTGCRDTPAWAPVPAPHRYRHPPTRDPSGTGILRSGGALVQASPGTGAPLR